MNKSIFREKSIERVTSPEQLNDRIRVTNPGVWMVLSSIIFILVGICVWGIFGKLDTVISVGAHTENGKTVCYVKEADFDVISEDMTVRIADSEYSISELSLQPVQVNEEFPQYLCHIGELSVGEWVYVIVLDDVYGEDGSIFSADVVVESIAPLSFVVN